MRPAEIVVTNEYGDHRVATLVSHARLCAKISRMSDVWLLTYEVVPQPGNPAFRKAGGAFVNCWILADSQAAAADVAVHFLSDNHWLVVELTDVERVDTRNERYPPASVTLIEQARTDGAAFCFNAWPA